MLSLSLENSEHISKDSVLIWAYALYHAHALDTICGVVRVSQALDSELLADDLTVPTFVYSIKQSTHVWFQWCYGSAADLLSEWFGSVEVCVDVRASGRFKTDPLTLHFKINRASIRVLSLYEVVLWGESVEDVCVLHLDI